MHKPDEAWLEPVLERHLGRVTAPEGLWDRVHNPAVRRSGNSTRRLAWASAAALFALVVAAWGLRASRGSAFANEALAVQALTRGPEHLQFRSNSAMEIRSWVKTRTGIDIPFPPETSSSKIVRLNGACAAGGTVEVAYRVGDQNATLIVTKAKSAPPGEDRHRFLSGGYYQGRSVSSWVMRGQLYTIAYAVTGDFRTACLLCHAGAQSLTALN